MTNISSKYCFRMQYRLWEKYYRKAEVMNSTKDYMVKVLSNAANTKGVDVGACIASLGYKKLSDMPRDKYRELLKLAGCDE